MTVANIHKENCIHQWHKRLAHRHPDAIKRLEKEELAIGIHIEKCGIKSYCESCIKGKMFRTPFSKHSNFSTSGPRQLVHTDICEPMTVRTPGGKRYILTFVDDYSKQCRAFLISEKSETSNLIKKYVINCKSQFGQIPKTYRSDRGGEYGIEHQLTAPYSPQQN